MINRLTSVVTISSLCLALSFFVASCGGTINIGGQNLSYSDVCTSEVTACRAPGDIAITMSRDRPLFEGTPTSYLGSLVTINKVRQPRETCFTPSDTDYIFRDITIHATLLQEEDIEASVKAAVEASLGASGVDNLPSANLAVTTSVVSKLKENNYTNAKYTVYALRDAVFERIREAPQGSAEAKCREKLSAAKGRGFVSGLAIITAETNFDSSLQQQVNATVSGALQNFKVSNGAITAALSAQIALAISNKIEKTVSLKASQYQTVYSYGFWEDPFSAAATPNETKAVALTTNKDVNLFDAKLLPADIGITTGPVPTASPTLTGPTPPLTSPTVPPPPSTTAPQPTATTTPSQPCNFSCAQDHFYLSSPRKYRIKAVSVTPSDTEVFDVFEHTPQSDGKILNLLSGPREVTVPGGDSDNIYICTKKPHTGGGCSSGCALVNDGATMSAGAYSVTFSVSCE
jgi:hypothetical protein